MTEITKADLHEFKNDLKEIIGDKFDAHEERERLMFAPLSKTVQEHENILRGKDRTSGMIKKMNHLWFVASTGAIGLFWKAWDFLSHNPNPPSH